MTLELEPKHDVDHHFKGVCICSCVQCTLHYRPYSPKTKPGRENPDVMKCICTSCDVRRCGAREGVS